MCMEVNRKLRKFFPFANMAEEQGGIPIYFNVSANNKDANQSVNP